MAEKTLIIIKHDGVARGLMGEVIKRFERVGLKIVAMEFLQSTKDMGDSHYPRTEQWLSRVGQRTLKEYFEKGLDPLKELGTLDPLAIGKLVKGWLIDYLTILYTLHTPPHHDPHRHGPARTLLPLLG